MKTYFIPRPDMSIDEKNPHDCWAIMSDTIRWATNSKGVFLPVVQFVKLLCEGKYQMERSDD